MPKSSTRLTRHRSRAAADGKKRVELSLPASDVPMMKAAAHMLRKGGAEATKVREVLAPAIASPIIESGKDLVAFLRASPLMDTDLVFERERSEGRVVDLG